MKAAVAKIQPGEVSEPVRIPAPFLIVKLDARETVPFEKAKPASSKSCKRNVAKAW